ncbi:MAG TPA: hypothetical protein VE172_20150 [Stackebrandtia sp.]|jgi:uncharacterized protein YukE|uniref:hypothetical protein n=1 Tax=Stackebrandtia sp. TaxID=2023065 RepID=UPI002D396187|nr:hypothetical protein [Stackebrandtia sp.]HZE41118.1 hypothetical protein [Stackebrandtia sp.]
MNVGALHAKGKAIKGISKSADSHGAQLDGLRARIPGVWNGADGQAAGTDLGQHGKKLEGIRDHANTIANNTTRLAEGLTTAQGKAKRGQTIAQSIPGAKFDASKGIVDYKWREDLWGPYDKATAQGKANHAKNIKLANQANTLMADAVSEGNQLDSGFTAANTADKPLDQTKIIKAADDIGPKDPVVKQQQTAAFQATLGRAPVSKTDWELAAALDPTSRLPKNGGTNAVVAVGKITPHPGMGLVKIGLYIPSDEVFNMPHNDKGDNRGMNPNFNPEENRVALYVDYETGTVVARQNPSVDSAGNVKVGTPDVKIQESTTGAVHITYNAVNPFAPNIDGDMHHVKGDVTITPGQPAKIDGTIGDYPAFEAYQVNNDKPTQVILQDRADNEGSLGPLLELPTHHDIGNGQQSAAQFKAWRPLSGDYWELDPSTPPAPEVELGDPKNPPVAKPYEPFGGAEVHPHVPGVPDGPMI